jgi:hypothetical protein
MKANSALISEVLKSLPVKSIHEIPELEGLKYSDLLELHKNNEILFGYKLQENVIDHFGSKSQKVLDKVFLSVPIVFAISSLVFSFTNSNFYFLLGLPLVILSFFVSSQNLMKSGKSVFGIIMLGSIIYGFASMNMNSLNSLLALGFGFSTLSLTISRHQNKIIFEEVILSSEPLFIYYFLRGDCYFRSKSGRVFRCKIEK